MSTLMYQRINQNGLKKKYTVAWQHNMIVKEVMKVFEATKRERDVDRGRGERDVASILILSAVLISHMSDFCVVLLLLRLVSLDAPECEIFFSMCPTGSAAVEYVGVRNGWQPTTELSVEAGSYFKY